MHGCVVRPSGTRARRFAVDAHLSEHGSCRRARVGARRRQVASVLRDLAPSQSAIGRCATPWAATRRRPAWRLAAPSARGSRPRVMTQRGSANGLRRFQELTPRAQRHPRTCDADAVTHLCRDPPRQMPSTSSAGAGSPASWAIATSRQQAGVLVAALERDTATLAARVIVVARLATPIVSATATDLVFRPLWRVRGRSHAGVAADCRAGLELPGSQRLSVSSG